MGVPVIPPVGGTEVYADMELWAEIRRRVLTGEISKRDACRMYEIHWADAQEDPRPTRSRRGTAGAKPPPPTDHRAGPAGHPPDPRRRHEGPEEATAHRPSDLAAAAGRARLHRRLHDRQGRGAGVEGRPTKEVFLPLSHPPGEAQVDFGFAEVVVAGVPTPVALFVMSLPYADAVYCQAFPRECTESVPRRARAGVRFLRRGAPADRLRQHQDRGGEDRGEPGAGGDPRVPAAEESLPVRQSLLPGAAAEREGARRALVEYARSNFLVPVPRVDSLAELNARLDGAVSAGSGADDTRQAGDGGDAAWSRTGRRCCRCRRSGSRPRRVTEVAADSLSLVRFDTNAYSVPTEYAHRTLTVIGTVDEVRIVFEDRLVARHPRCWEREQ